MIGWCLLLSYWLFFQFVFFHLIFFQCCSCFQSDSMCLHLKKKDKILSKSTFFANFFTFMSFLSSFDFIHLFLLYLFTYLICTKHLINGNHKTIATITIKVNIFLGINLLSKDSRVKLSKIIPVLSSTHGSVTFVKTVSNGMKSYLSQN